MNIEKKKNYSASLSLVMLNVGGQSTVCAPVMRHSFSRCISITITCFFFFLLCPTQMLLHIYANHRAVEEMHFPRTHWSIAVQIRTFKQQIFFLNSMINYMPCYFHQQNRLDTVSPTFSTRLNIEYLVQTVIKVHVGESLDQI